MNQRKRISVISIDKCKFNEVKFYNKFAKMIHTQCDYCLEVSISYVVKTENHPIDGDHYRRNQLYQIDLMLHPYSQFVVFYILNLIVKK